MGFTAIKDILNFSKSCKKILPVVSDPIPSEYDLKYASENKILKEKYESGKPDELDCPFCGYNVYFKNSFMEIQSVIKFPQPAAVSKVYYDYGNAFGEAEHLVSLGYSLL